MATLCSCLPCQQLCLWAPLLRATSPSYLTSHPTSTCSARSPATLITQPCPVFPCRLRIVTLLGAGLLIGTALVVIIPEGMHMWLASTSSSHAHGDHEETELPGSGHEHEHEHEHQEHWQMGASMAAGFAFMLLVDKLSGGHHGHAHSSTTADLPSSTTATPRWDRGTIRGADYLDGTCH